MNLQPRLDRLVGQAGVFTAVAAVLLLSPSVACVHAAPEAAPLAAAAKPGPLTPKVVAALQSAHLAARRLSDFSTRAAKAADAETGVAKTTGQFLRAAARSAEVNAGLLAAALAAGGGKPLDDTETPAQVKTTKENLQAFATLANASKDRAAAAAGDARAESDAASRRLLDFQREAATELLRLSRELGKPAASPPSTGTKPIEYHVSRTCGYVVDRLDIDRCPVCLAGKSDFEKIN